MQGRELGPSFAVAHHPWHVALQGREGQISPGRGGPTPDAAPQVISTIPVSLQGSSMWSPGHAGQLERPSDLFQLKYFLLCNDWELRLQSTNTSYLAGQSGLCHHPVSPEGWAGSDLPAMGFYRTSEKYAGRLVCFTGSNIFLMN